MSRYRGPIFKKSRRYQFSILEQNKEFSKGKKRETITNQKNRRAKLSEYGIHLYEKQKLRFLYGLQEKQFKNTFLKATKIQGVTGLNFLRLLEQRFDNVVYRLGFAQTRRQARQLVTHRHFLLNGKKVNIPSLTINVGDKIKLKPKSEKLAIIKEAIQNRMCAPWLKREQFSGTFERLPERAELNKDINESLVVEYYNK